ncbi:TPA: HTH domain-containing protein [Enterococcus faecium]|nr:HTH domain-containing protein [Enterococcus faecium]
MFITKRRCKQMDLNKRQLQILVVLRNKNHWITSEELAEALGTNKKTIQTEIKNMLAIYEKKIIIQSNKRSGYFLESIESETKQQIIQEVTKHKIYSSMDFRASTIVTYLLFQKGYVSMQKIADIFFLSKTAVSLQIKTILRWIERNPKLELEVSSTKGLKIIAEENSKRIFLSLVGTETVIQHARFPQQISTIFSNIMPTVQKTLKEVLISYNYIVSGEDFIRFSRYLVLTILRREELLEKTNRYTLFIPMVETLTKKLSSELPYSFSNQEKQAIENRLLELNYLMINDEKNKEIEKNLRAFEQTIIRFLDLPVSLLFHETEFLLTHIKQMKTRMDAGHNTMNHFVQKIISRYPLEIYLIRRFFPIHFQLRPNLAESAYFVLYLAEALNPFRKQGEILIVSNQPISILNTLKKQIQQSMNMWIKECRIEPVYLFKNQSNKITEYDAILTIEQELIFEWDDLIYLPSVLDEFESWEIYQILREKLTIVEEKKKTKLLDHYYKEENQIKIHKKIDSIQQLISPSSDLVMLPLNAETLLCCLIKSQVETKITEYQLEIPLIHQQRKIKRVFFVSFDYKRNDILVFFQAVSDLLG